jgi:hypothetical protein
MTNEEILAFLENKKASISLMIEESKKILNVLDYFEDVPILFFGSAQTHNMVIAELEEYMPWLDLKIEELNAIIENTN